ncbi:hypothetical protein [Streptomyces sp. NPDC001876]|uniref:hypothetical protein n=1 Tax=Streptomyces sp. NPDC001876 TaxID=3154402 RepID=UPI003331774F
MADGQPIDVQLPAVPDHIPHTTVQSICDQLGLPSHVREIHIGLDEIKATILLCDSDGHRVEWGDDAPTAVVCIPVKWGSDL